ncbi:hypothetical protein [Mucilaginibacter pedocola]|uniref:Uncharacterized protein n=1 Tax=Mucilaginibacter pedocola TaxID=1792845 RepID=A0A1S9P853_9SPHI|nr:hypothetical protein [Mucilaginibacter pedocola]OOQ57135.1 hypothetical protein BC343_16580 [Mucilaginibacter pedocola]
MSKLTNVIIAALFLLFAGTTAFAIFEHKQRIKSDRIIGSNRKTVNQAATIINHYLDTNSRQHTVIAADENKLPAKWYKNGTAISGGLVDTVTKALNIAKKQLIEITRIAGTVRAEKLKAERKYDSLQRITYFYKDKYLQLSFRPALKNSDTTDNGEFSFRYNDSINIVKYWKRKWFLGAKKNYIDIFSNDARTTINGVDRLIVEQHKPDLEISLQMTGNYAPYRHLFYFGPGVQLNFDRFSVIGDYHYDFSARNWQPSVATRFDIVKF